MDRVAVAVILVILLGVWVHPFLSGASQAPTASSGDAGQTDSVGPMPDPSQAPSPATQPHSAVPPATRPVDRLKVVRGHEGFWRLAQTPEGVWWFLTPRGELEFLNTVTTVVPYQLGRDPEGPHYISRDWPGSVPGDGDLEAWATRTLRRVQEAGFKGLGAWCHPVFHKFDVPITRDLNVWTWMPGPCKRFYTPQWATTAEHAIKNQVEPLRDNVNLVGYFIDNELDWGDGVSGPGYYFNGLANDDPNRRMVLTVIRSVWPSIEDFNRDWKSELKDYAELEKWESLPLDRQAAYGRLATAWLSRLAEDYFRLTTSLIRKHDPNHLVLGVRFKGYAPREVVRASRDYTDAQSLNTYVSDARLDLEQFRMLHEQSQQPLMITEYSFHALDGRSGNRNTVGFAAQVLDQQARADGYEQFTKRLARVPWVVGADWFQWADEPPSGRGHDGEDVNFGVMDIDDRPYETLVRSIRKTTPQLNGLHAASYKDDGTDIWRESFASKPVMRVPYLAEPVRLNGELSDWLPQAKLQGVRHSQTVGLERSPLPLPNVYLGWREEGLYIGMEVFDKDIQGAPPKGWWWTRDSVELWLSTRPVASDQTWYDSHCHQFFFVPNDFPDADGRSGTTGQWHRPGDALQDNRIPHPDVRDAVRVLPDRYVVEMLIPAKALVGFDPQNQPALAFNIHMRNWQHAIDYFWSAPKEVLTQLRPNTWGSLYLEPQGKSPAIAGASAEAAADPAPAVGQ